MNRLVKLIDGWMNVGLNASIKIEILLFISVLTRFAWVFLVLIQKNIARLSWNTMKCILIADSFYHEENIKRLINRKIFYTRFHVVYTSRVV